MFAAYGLHMEHFRTTQLGCSVIESDHHEYAYMGVPHPEAEDPGMHIRDPTTTEQSSCQQICFSV
jgi:hypothetical protein